jgi:hypothetical protein
MSTWMYVASGEGTAVGDQFVSISSKRQPRPSWDAEAELITRDGERGEHRRRQPLAELLHLVGRARGDRASAGDDQRPLGPSERVGGGSHSALVAAWT